MFYDTYASGFFVLSCFNSGGETFLFSGSMQTDDSIIIGKNGFHDYIKKKGVPDITSYLEGRFSVVYNRSRKVQARTDIFGQEAIFYYCKNGVWALSNSFYLVLEELKSNGVELSVDYDTVMAFKVKSGFVQQLISNDTLVSEVKVLPRDKCLEIDKKNSTFYFLDVDRCPQWFEEKSYEEKIKYYVSRSADINYSLVKKFQGKVTVDITGGVDSRLVLATLLASGVDLSDINFVCAKGDGNDFDVASQLSEKYRFNIKNKSLTYNQGSPSKLYELWKLGNLGVYNPFYFPRSSRPQGLLHYHGACGECFRDFYNSTAVDFLNKISDKEKCPEAAFSLNRKFGKSLSYLSSGVDSKSCMVEHYQNFRSRYHFGRGAFKNLHSYMITPLASPLLLSAFNMLDSKEQERNVLGLDIFMACDPNLLSVSFDHSEKNFSELEIANSRLFGCELKKSEQKEMELFFTEEPRQEKTGEIADARDFLVRDLKKLKGSVVKSGFYNEDDIETAEKLIFKKGRITMLAQEAVKIISIGHVLNFCNSLR